MADKSKETIFAPGGIIKFVGLIKKPELNGCLGAIKKVLSNGRFMVMTTFGKNDLAIRAANLEKLSKRDSLSSVDQCPNEKRPGTNGGMMIWPYIKEVNGVPSVNWSETDKLHQPSNPFDVDYSKESWKIAVNTPGSPTILMSRMFDPVMLDSKMKVGIEFVETQCDVNEMKMVESFRWKAPRKWLCNAYNHIGHLNLKLCFIYDKDSHGPINDWATQILPLPWLKGSNVFAVPGIRGPFLYSCLHLDVHGNWKEDNFQTLNSVKRLLYVHKNFGNPIQHQKKTCKTERSMPNCTEPCIHCKITVMEHLCHKVCGTHYTVRTPESESLLAHQKTSKIFEDSMKAYNNLVAANEISDDPTTMKLVVIKLQKCLRCAELEELSDKKTGIRLPLLVWKVMIAWCTSDLLSHSTELKMN